MAKMNADESLCVHTCYYYCVYFVDMLKKYNPDLKGYSTGTIPVLSQDIFSKKAGFNVAVSGAKSKWVNKNWKWAVDQNIFS